MKFLIKEPQKDLNFYLVYRDEDCSFDVEPLKGSGDILIMINDLQLEIDHRGKIIYVWGYCPLIKYQETAQYPQKYQPCSLVALLDKPPIPGISYRLNDKERWPIYINKKKGWICIGNPKINGKQILEFVPNCVANLEDQEITAIWLKPKDLPS